MSEKTCKEGDLRVWWIPQVPMQPFEYPVSTVSEGAILCDLLALYDKFQYDNNIKPDYCNCGGLQIFDDGEWCDWYDEETGESFEDWIRAKEQQ